MNHLTTSIVLSSVPGVAPTCLNDGLSPVYHPLQLDVRCPVVIAAAIPDAIMFPTDKCIAHEVPSMHPTA